MNAQVRKTESQDFKKSNQKVRDRSWELPLPMIKDLSSVMQAIFCFTDDSCLI